MIDVLISRRLTGRIMQRTTVEMISTRDYTILTIRAPQTVSSTFPIA